LAGLFFFKGGPTVKRIRAIFKSYMIRPTLYRSVSKFVAALTLVLLWDRFVNLGRLNMFRDGFLIAGVILLTLAWFSYLGLDGLTWKKLFRRNTEAKKEKPRKWGGGDIIDFADEHVVRLEELEEDERRVVYLLSSLIPGLIYLAISLVALIVL